jgi:hypothetical protein
VGWGVGHCCVGVLKVSSSSYLFEQVWKQEEIGWGVKRVEGVKLRGTRRNPYYFDYDGN